MTNDKKIVNRIFKSKGRAFSLTGQNARCLTALIESGNRGITALEMSSWALRLAAYVHILRSEYLLEIETITEPHPGGHHGRYILRDEVEIIEKEEISINYKPAKNIPFIDKEIKGIETVALNISDREKKYLEEKAKFKTAWRKLILTIKKAVK